MHDDKQAIINTILSANPVDVYMGLGPVSKLLTSVALIIGAVVLVIAVIRRARNGPRSSLLGTLGWFALALGALGGVYTAFNSYAAAQMLHETRFVIVLPSIIECLYQIALGVIVWLIAQYGNVGARRS